MNLTFAEVVLLAFWAVLIAELVGDKSLYALASLAMRFRWRVVFVSFVFASAVKLGIAALLANAITQFHSRWTDFISAAAFFISAALIWVREGDEIEETDTGRRTWQKGMLISFCSFFFSEWGDPGQIATAALVLRSHLVLGAWLGATLAITIKGAAALILGVQIRNRLPLNTLRALSSVSCCVLGTLAIVRGFIAQA